MDKHDLSAAGRHKLAATGVARPDGSYPIADQQDLDNAVKDWIRTGRSLAVKSWIEKRAKAIGAEVPAELDAKPSDNDGDEVAVAKARMAARGGN